MREIKFRAWDAEEKVMWQPLTLEQIIRADWEFETDPYEYTLPWKDYMWSQHDKTVWMQYTGLKDKNSKEIYEGDIVASTLKENKGGVIEWCIPNACFVVREDENTLIPIDIKGGTARMKETEVIGNIYENPELMKNYETN